MKNVFIVGAGLSGCCAARILAENGYQVSIFEQRDKISGNLYDYKDKNGLFIQCYGPHFFHTNDKDVWNFINKFSSFELFNLQCGVYLKDRYTASPFNFDTIDILYDAEKADLLKKELLKEFNSKTVTILSLLNSSNDLIRNYAMLLFEEDYKPYTSKQWGMAPEEVSFEIISRVPVRLSYIDAYFDDIYQGQPIDGYFSLIKNILDHPNIKVFLNINANNLIQINNSEIFFDGCKVSKNNLLVYTGAVDELFNYKYGELPYRSLSFKYKELCTSSFQSRAVVAYPKHPEYTRITEFSKLYNKKLSNISIIAEEYPESYKRGYNERYYPLLTDSSKKMYSDLANVASTYDGLILIGRLANYRYFNMDQAIKNVILKLNNIVLSR